jgi:3D (Asp-Asp-Asp) domain-containing protein
MLTLTDLSRAIRTSSRTPRLFTAAGLGGALLVFLGQTPIAPKGSEFIDPVTVPPGLPAWCLTPQELDPPNDFPHQLFQIPVTVTAYSSTADQTDSTPFVTASNTRVRRGIVALSRDLLREFTPGAPFGYGDRVELEGVGSFVVEDTMHPRFRQRVDIWFPHRVQARRWGVQRFQLAHLSPQAQAEGLSAQDSAPLLFAAALSE